MRRDPTRLEASDLCDLRRALGWEPASILHRGVVRALWASLTVPEAIAGFGGEN